MPSRTPAWGDVENDSKGSAADGFENVFKGSVKRDFKNYDRDDVDKGLEDSAVGGLESDFKDSAKGDFETKDSTKLVFRESVKSWNPMDILFDSPEERSLGGKESELPPLLPLDQLYVECGFAPGICEEALEQWEHLAVITLVECVRFSSFA